MQILHWLYVLIQTFDSFLQIQILISSMIDGNSSIFFVKIQKKEKRSAQEENLGPLSPLSDVLPLDQFCFLKKEGGSYDLI